MPSSKKRQSLLVHICKFLVMMIVNESATEVEAKLIKSFNDVSLVLEKEHTRNVPFIAQ